MCILQFAYTFDILQKLSIQVQKWRNNYVLFTRDGRSYNLVWSCSPHRCFQQGLNNRRKYHIFCTLIRMLPSLNKWKIKPLEYSDILTNMSRRSGRGTLWSFFIPCAQTMLPLAAFWFYVVKWKLPFCDFQS